MKNYLSPYQLHKRWAGVISPKTLANWRAKNSGPAFVKVGGRVLYPVEGVTDFEAKGGGMKALAVSAFLWLSLKSDKVLAGIPLIC